MLLEESKVNFTEMKAPVLNCSPKLFIAVFFVMAKK